ncbi:DJ-1 [Westerdykella ornata]|uniref:D-lactate dehydratase n=1 Tax=Westerdykella ornata TaxID=318751 RepID=A0A6A6J9F1_WESOR|nr:DJ-1 [Westerdykella ornata]KAF2272897.1 DJ-1 [Westerdykella ornata]
MTKPKVLMLVADGSEEIEFVTTYDVLTRAGFEVKSAGVDLKHEFAHMSRNIRLLPDSPTLLALPHQSAHQTYDMLVLPGGMPGAKTFAHNDAVLAMIANFRTEGKYVAAICAATIALVESERRYGGEGRKGKLRVTSHPSVRGKVEKEEGAWEYSEERVVVDAGVVTSRGPGTALLFALTIVELLAGKEKRDEVAGPMIVAETL